MNRRHGTRTSDERTGIVEINNKIVRRWRRTELLASRNNERSAGSKYFQIHSSSWNVPAYRLTNLEKKKENTWDFHGDEDSYHSSVGHKSV